MKKCPYCNRELKAGVIQSPQPLVWRKKRNMLGRFDLGEEGVLLSDRSEWKGAAIQAYHCPVCQKILVDYKGKACDLNRLEG